ncbi:MAG: ribonuclease III [Alphaproteobacteria bacterium]
MAGTNSSLAEDSALAALEARIGYEFKNRDVLMQALTHASAGARALTNERLEFLGDRVLGLLAAEALMTRFPDTREGELAPRLNALVRKEACAGVAKDLDLARYLRVSGSEGRAGALKPAILADACEAVMAAVYLDGGIEAARRFFVSAWARVLEEVDVVPRDAKSVLQEWTQDRGLGLPRYEQINRSGPDHLPEFTVRASVVGQGEATGTGNSKRAAEQAAAAAFLVNLQIWSRGEADRALASGSA